jgi:protein-disulfide isomerase
MDEQRMKPSGFRMVKAILDTLAALVVLAVGCLVLYQTLQGHFAARAAGVSKTRSATRPPEPLPESPVSIDGAATAGSARAHVGLIIFSDFQCPYCGKFARDTFPQIKTQYVDSGKVLVAFRHMPLTGIHPFARKAAETAACAGKQGRFWEMHDSLFADQNSLDTPALMSRAHRLNLESSQFESCLINDSPLRIKRDMDEADHLAIHGTPTFLVGTMTLDGNVHVLQRFSGAQPFSQFQNVLDGLLLGGKVKG